MPGTTTEAGQQLEKTDLRRWRLGSDEGVRNWHYLSEEEAKNSQQSFAERYFLGLRTVRPSCPQWQQ